MKLVSVIIPYFKKRIYIEEAIKSVLRQSYKKLEIILIYDDENHDDLNFIKKIQRTDNRINLFINQKTLGVGETRNLGIKKANGEYIAFLDADDIWKKNKIKKQIHFMEANKALISHTSYEVLNKNKKILNVRKAKDYYNYNSLLYSCDIGLSTVMVKKKLLKDDILFPNLKTKEDFVLWLKILKINVKIYALNENLTFWRKVDNSLSSSVIQKIKDGYIVYHEYMKFNFLKSLFFLFLLSFNSLFK
tara:strand:- start:1063 stop:1803 length:741 start_codon:yes stop_codon:yes gene_type:complete